MGRVIMHPREIGPLQFADFGGYDISEMYYADSGIKYYLYMPKKYFMKITLRLSFVSAFLACLSFSAFFAFTAPLIAFLFFKIGIFISWCETVNLSRKKLWTFFIAEHIAFHIAGYFLRRLIALIFLII